MVGRRWRIYLQNKLNMKSSKVSLKNCYGIHKLDKIKVLNFDNRENLELLNQVVLKEIFEK